MKRTRIKFCGFTRAEDALAAAALGVDAIGLVLVPASKRALGLDAAAAIRRRLPPFVTAVILLQDAPAAAVQEAIDAVRPDLLQFHGAEPPEFCESFSLPYLKAVAMQDPGISLSALARAYAGAAGLLLDGHAAGELGGQGKAFDWSRARAAGKPLVLAGGLSAGNVGAAIAAARPYAVDVSSGIESAPGIKDSGKMSDFVDAVRRADRELAD